MKLLKTLTIAGGLFASPYLSAADLPDFSLLIKDNAKTVVQIDSRDNGEPNLGNYRQSPGNPTTPEELFRYFFEGPGGGLGQGQTQSQPSYSHGSGFFIDDQGYILTNAHVVKGGDDITVSTTDQKEYDAELIGLDERTDVALLKIKAKNIPAAKIGDSDKIAVGNWVLAIGSPFGFDYTATKGIVSAVSRSLPDGTYVPFIQTDAAVNPGNSGGPLFNLDGEVIGINSQIYSKTGTFNGLAFAIPINTAMNVANQLKSKGFVSRGWLGVAIQNVDQDLASSFGLDNPEGALVSSTVEGSPAEKAGIKAGDIILKFNDKKIHKSSELPPIVGTVATGTETTVELLRHGKHKTLSVTIGELDEGEKPNVAKSEKTVENHGIRVHNLSKQQKQEADTDYGVVITAVSADSRAAKAGFRVDDIIVNIANQPIRNTKDFRKAMKKVDDKKPVAVLVIRQGFSLFIPL